MYPSPLSIPQKRYPHSIGNNRKRHCPESIRRTLIERDAPLLYFFFLLHISYHSTSIFLRWNRRKKTSALSCPLECCNTRENTQLIDIGCYRINSAAKYGEDDDEKKNVRAANTQGPSSRMLWVMRFMEILSIMQSCAESNMIGFGQLFQGFNSFLNLVSK